MSASNNPSAVRRRLEERYRRLAKARQVRPLAAIVARFNEIDGGTLGAMVSADSCEEPRLLTAGRNRIPFVCRRVALARLRWGVSGFRCSP
jgi:hypothetical protein